MKAVLSWDFERRSRRAEVISVPDPPPPQWIVPLLPAERSLTMDPMGPPTAEPTPLEKVVFVLSPGSPSPDANGEATAWYYEQP